MARACVSGRSTTIADAPLSIAWFDELVAINFRARDGDVEAVFLHAARIVKDAIDLAIERADDLTHRDLVG